MADWLLLRLPRNATDEVSWILADARGNAISAPQTTPLSEVAMRAAGRHICVLVPSTDVLLAEPELPAKAGAKLHQVVPYALEEQLAEDIDDLHFAIGKRVGNSVTTPVAVVSHALMDDWLTLLKSAVCSASAIRHPILAYFAKKPTAAWHLCRPRRAC